MRKQRISRDRLLIGTYCLAEYARSEEHIRALREAGVDFVCGVPASDRDLLDRCEKYGIGVFANDVLPSWWGGYGENAGGMAEAVPLVSYERAREEYVDHPAIWGLDMGDEPSALDFPHYGKLFAKEKELFPELLPYVNLYPSYGVRSGCMPDEIRRQLGAESHEAYIDEFVRWVDSDYICYDFYMYSASAEEAYENLRVVSERCKGAGRDMWIVLQVNSDCAEQWISLDQLRHQAYTALAFGARCISWACWTAGWWHNQVLDEAGRATRQYDRVCAVNRELRAWDERYMKYRCRTTRRLSEKASSGFGLFERIDIEGDGFALAGFMEKADGGEAALLADCESSGEYAARVILKEGARLTRAMRNGVSVRPTECGEREYLLRMDRCAGLWLEAE